jgi:hypothetical protein
VIAAIRSRRALGMAAVHKRVLAFRWVVEHDGARPRVRLIGRWHTISVWTPIYGGR